MIIEEVDFKLTSVSEMVAFFDLYLLYIVKNNVEPKRE